MRIQRFLGLTVLVGVLIFLCINIDGANGQQVTLAHTFKGHSWGIFAIAFSPNGRFLATGSWDATIKIWSGISFGINSQGKFVTSWGKLKAGY